MTIPGRVRCPSGRNLIPAYNAGTMYLKPMDPYIPEFDSINYTDPVGVVNDQTTVQDGSWDSPATWGGTVPVSISNVIIEHEVTINDASPICEICSIRSAGTLKFNRTATTQLQVKTLYVLGRLDIGYTEDPITGSCTVIFRDLPIAYGTTSDAYNSGFDPAGYGNGLVILGSADVTVCGLEKTPFAALTAGPSAAATNSTLATAVTGWVDQDQIAIPDTRDINAVGRDSYPDNQCEVLTLNGAPAGGTAVQTYESLSYGHVGVQYNDGGGAVEYFKPHWCNLTRNVVFKSEQTSDTAGTRGHIMATGSCHLEFRNCEIRNVGRTRNRALHITVFDGSGTPTEIGKNQIARYALHYHHHAGRKDEGGLDYFTNYPYASVVSGVVTRDDQPRTTLAAAPADIPVTLSAITGKTDTLQDCTADNTTNTFTHSGHGMSDGNHVLFGSAGNGGFGAVSASPTGITDHVRYYVVNSTSSTFQVSTTLGGAAVTFTDDGSGVRYVPAYSATMSETVIVGDVIQDSNGSSFSVVAVNGSNASLTPDNHDDWVNKVTYPIASGVGVLFARSIKLVDMTGFPTSYPYFIGAGMERMLVTGATWNGSEWDVDVWRSADREEESTFWPTVYGIDLSSPIVGATSSTPTVNNPVASLTTGTRSWVYNMVKWSVVTHDTHFSLVEDTIAFDSVGAVFVSEQNEIENVYQNNFALLGTSFNSQWRHSTEKDNTNTNRYTGREGVGHWSRFGGRKWYRGLRSANLFEQKQVETAFGFEIVQELYDKDLAVPSVRGEISMGAGSEIIQQGRQLPYEIDDIEVYCGQAGSQWWWVGGGPGGTGEGSPKYGMEVSPAEAWQSNNIRTWNLEGKSHFHYPSYQQTYKNHVSVGGGALWFMGDYDWVRNTVDGLQLLGGVNTLQVSFCQNGNGYGPNYPDVGVRNTSIDSLNEPVNVVKNCVFDSQSANVTFNANKNSGSSFGQHTAHKRFRFDNCDFRRNYGGSDFSFVSTTSGYAGWWQYCQHTIYQCIVNGVQKSATYERKAWWDIQHPDVMMHSNAQWDSPNIIGQVGSPEVSRLYAGIDASTTTVLVKYNDGTVSAYPNTGQDIPNPTIMNGGTLQWANGQVWQTRGTAGVDWEPFFVRCGDEIMQVDNIIDGTDHWILTVQRGQESTIAATHSLDDVIGTTNRSLYNRYEPDVAIYGKWTPPYYPEYTLKTNWYTPITGRDTNPGLCTYYEMSPDNPTVDTDFVVEGVGFLEAVSE